MTIKMSFLAESATLFKVIIRNAPNPENVLIFATNASIETYNDTTIDNIIWIRAQSNLPDPMKKVAISKKNALGLSLMVNFSMKLNIQ